MPTPEYKQFLRSAEWAEIRTAMIDRAGGRCEICGRPNQLDVHHKTYARFGGQELPSDLQVVCRRCHEYIHRQTLTRARYQRPEQRASDHPCEAVRPAKKGPCSIPAMIAQSADGRWLCHVHHPDGTYQKQRAARKVERERKIPMQKKKKRVRFRFARKTRSLPLPPSPDDSMTSKLPPTRFPDTTTPRTPHKGRAPNIVIIPRSEDGHDAGPNDGRTFHGIDKPFHISPTAGKA